MFGSTSKSTLSPGIPVKGGITGSESSSFYLTSNSVSLAALSTPLLRLEEVDPPRVRIPLL